MSPNPSRLHAASLVLPSLHNPLLLNLVDTKISMDMIRYIARKTEQVVPNRGEWPELSPPHTHHRAKLLYSLDNFICYVVERSCVKVPTFLTTLVYLHRLRSKLSLTGYTLGGFPFAQHRVFLSALIVASKYLNDSCLKNKHWQQIAVLFSLDEVNAMEKQFLLLLGYDLYYDEPEACRFFAPFMDSNATDIRIKQQQEQDASTRAAAIDRVSKAGQARARVQIDVHRSPSPPSVSTLTSEVYGIAKRLSTVYLSSRSQPPPPPPSSSSPEHRPPAPSPIHRSASSSSSSSSEMGSLLDDSGLSSSSSSEFTSEDESEEEVGSQPLKKFHLQPAPVYSYRNHNRVRIASDTSSIKSTATITSKPIIHSPTQRFVLANNNVCHRRAVPSKRVSSLSYGGPQLREQQPSRVPSGNLAPSLTMPSLTLGRSAGFLSRMWGAAKGQVSEKDKSTNHGPLDRYWKGANGHIPAPDTVKQPLEGYTSSGLRRLVLVPSRSTVFRGGGGIDV